MDALLLALLGCLLGEIGDKSQLLVLALATRFQRNGAVIAGIIVAAIANAALSATAGAWIGPMLGSDPRLLFLSLSVLFLGIGLLWPVTSPDPLASWPTGMAVGWPVGRLASWHARQPAGWPCWSAGWFTAGLLDWNSCWFTRLGALSVYQIYRQITTGLRKDT